MQFFRPKSLILSLLLLFLLVGCQAVAPVASTGATTEATPATSQSTATSTELIPLKVAVAPYLSYAPFFIAQAEGYFAEEGLDVELVRVTRSSDAIASLAQGQLDVAGFPIASGLLNAIVRDSGLKIVASKERTVEQDCVYTGFVIRTGAPLTATTPITPDLLKSLRYDVTPTGVSGYVLDLFLQQYGLTLEDITLVDTANAATALELMQQGGLDFAGMTEPWVTQARATGAGDAWLSRNDVAPDNQLAIVAYGPTILNDNPVAGERFMVAYLRAVRRFAEGMTESTLAVLEQELELDRTLLSEMCLPYIPLDGALNAQSIIEFGDWAAAKDLIDGPVTTEMFWEPRFVDYANQQLEGKN